MLKKSSLSDQVRRAIDASGKSRYRIAKDLSVSEATLSRFMSGERGLTLTLLDRLADYLGLTLCSRASR
jgi:transcriptional regulator with XRE-family HTH domain